MMENSVLLMSVRPEHAQKIFSGTKTVELRRTSPRIAKGDLVLVYVSSPVKAVMGAFRVEQVIDGRPEALWSIVKGKAGLTRQEFEAYFSGASRGCGIFFTDVLRLHKPVSLQRLREKWPAFQPPQGYCYVTHRKMYRELTMELEQDGSWHGQQTELRSSAGTDRESCVRAGGQ